MEVQAFSSVHTRWFLQMQAAAQVRKTVKVFHVQDKWCVHKAVYCRRRSNRKLESSMCQMLAQTFPVQKVPSQTLSLSCVDETLDGLRLSEIVADNLSVHAPETSQLDPIKTELPVEGDTASKIKRRRTQPCCMCSHEDFSKHFAAQTSVNQRFQAMQADTSYMRLHCRERFVDPILNAGAMYMQEVRNKAWEVSEPSIRLLAAAMIVWFVRTVDLTMDHGRKGAFEIPLRRLLYATQKWRVPRIQGYSARSYLRCTCPLVEYPCMLGE